MLYILQTLKDLVNYINKSQLMNPAQTHQGNPIKTLHIFALLFTIISFSSSFELPYAPPPAANVTQIVQFNKSAQSSRLITSNRLEALELVQNAGNTTNFKLSFFNRSAANYTNIYLIENEPGIWTHLKQSKETLSCNLIYDTKNSLFGFLLFLSQEGTFKILSKISLADIKSLLAPTSNSLNYSQIAQMFTLGENCNLIYLFDGLYDLSNSSKLTKVTVPTGWTNTSYSENFQFGVNNNQLFRFNTTSRQYESVYTFSNPEKTYETYYIKQRRGRMLVSASYVISTQNTTNKIIQDVYIFTVTQNGTATSFVSRTRLDGTINGSIYADVQVSSQLTKMGFIYTPINDTQSRVFAKSIDYNSKKIIDLTFSDQIQADKSFSQSPAGSFTFNDNFLVVRRKNSSEAAQEGHQVIGTKIVYFSKRILTGDMELSRWKKLAIDHYFRDRLVVLNSYETDNGITINQIDYGNYRDTTRIITPVIPPYIQFQQPKHSFKQPINHENFTWGFYDITPGASTNVTILRINPFAPDHVDKFNQIVAGNLQLITKSTNCRIFYELLTKQYILYAFDSPAGQTTTSYPLALVLAGSTISDNDTWYISERCDKFTHNQQIFILSNKTYVPVSNNFSRLSLKAIDADMNYVINDGEIWKFNKNQNIYVKYSTNASILSKPYIYNNQNIVFIVASNSTNAPVDFQALAFIDNNSTLTTVFNYRSIFTSVPSFDTSNFLTNFVVYGRKGQAQVVDLFEIDYVNRKSISINFPYRTIRDFEQTLIKVFDSHFYVRQIYDRSKSTNTTYTSINQQEFVYYLNERHMPQLLVQRDLTAAQASTWVQTLVVSVNEVHFHLATQSSENITGKNNVIVRVVQLDPKQAHLNNRDQEMHGNVVNGTLYVCPMGCSECVPTTSACTACKQGYTFVASSALCMACAPGCLSCDPLDKNKCYSCVDRTYLKGNQCLHCDSACRTCKGSATSCNACLQGKTYSSDSNQCVQCPRNCLSCSNRTTCTTCNRGFIAINGNCTGCSIFCSQCSPTDISQCTACGRGLQLASGKCTKCPQNCLECNNNICTTCIAGYNPNANGTCILNCKYPCATCAENQPSLCTSCFSSSNLTSGTCAPNLQCNKTGTCVDCGQGYGYFLLAKYCYACQDLANISNCIQCSQTNPQVCAKCKDGFYSDSTGCISCNQSCSNCIGDNLCTACQTGYTLLSDQKVGQCQQCLSPCLTCTTSPSFCITCVSNFTLKGWKCQNNTRVDFSFTLKAEKTAVLAKTADLAKGLLTMIGEDPSKTERVTFQTFTQGSLLVTGSLDPSSGASEGAKTLYSKLSSNSQLAGFTVTSFSVVATNTETTPTSGGSEQNKAGLIAGLVIGLIGFSVIVGIIIYCYCNRRSENIENIGSESDKNMVGSGTGFNQGNYEMQDYYKKGEKNEEFN